MSVQLADFTEIGMSSSNLTYRNRSLHSMRLARSQYDRFFLDSFSVLHANKLASKSCLNQNCNLNSRWISERRFISTLSEIILEMIHLRSSLFNLTSSFGDQISILWNKNFVRIGETVTATDIGLAHYDPTNGRNNEWLRRLRKLDMELVDCEGIDRESTYVCFTTILGGDACYGDSGSLIYNEDGEVLALTSYGNPVVK